MATVVWSHTFCNLTHFHEPLDSKDIEAEKAEILNAVRPQDDLRGKNFCSLPKDKWVIMKRES